MSPKAAQTRVSLALTLCVVITTPETTAALSWVESFEAGVGRLRETRGDADLLTMWNVDEQSLDGTTFRTSRIDKRYAAIAPFTENSGAIGFTAVVQPLAAIGTSGIHAHCNFGLMNSGSPHNTNHFFVGFNYAGGNDRVVFLSLHDAAGAELLREEDGSIPFEFGTTYFLRATIDLPRREARVELFEGGPFGAVIGVLTLTFPAPAGLEFDGLGVANSERADPSNQRPFDFRLHEIALADPRAAATDTLLVSAHLTSEVHLYDMASGALLRSFGDANSLDGPIGLAVSPHTGNLLVASEITDSIEEFDWASGFWLRRFASGGLSRPSQMIFAPNGNLLVTSRVGDQIVEYDGISGSLVRVVSTGGPLDGPTDLVFSPFSGNLLVASWFTNEVLAYDWTSGTFSGVFAQGSGMNAPFGIVFGPDGHLYVANRDADAILRFDGITGAFIDVFASGAEMDGPLDLAFSKDGRLLVGSNVNRWIAEYDAESGSFLGILASGGLDYPIALLVTSSQDCLGSASPTPLVFIGSQAMDAVSAHTQAGAFSRTFATAPTGLDFPNGMLLDPDTGLFVSSVLTNSVIQYNIETAAPVRQFSGGGLSAPDGLLLTDDTLLVSSFGSDSVKEFNRETGLWIRDFVAPTTGGLDGPAGLAWADDGAVLLVASQRTDQVLAYDGVSGAFLGVRAAGGGLDQPDSLLVDDAGRLLIAGFSNDAVMGVDGNGVATPFIAPGSGGLDGPSGLAVLPSGGLIVSSFFTGEVLEFDAADGSFVGVFADIGENSQPTDIAAAVICSTDCNRNQLPDRWDIDLMNSFDMNGNDVPDDCECLGDLTGDDIVGLDDLAGVLAAFGSAIGNASFNPLADLDGNGAIDLADLSGFLARFGTECS